MIKLFFTDPLFAYQRKMTKKALTLFNTLALSFLLLILSLTILITSSQVSAGVPQTLHSAVDCGLTTYTVANEADLNEAIGCFNTAVAGTYEIEITSNITLSTDTTVISNSLATLELNGNGFTIDGDYQGHLLYITDGDVTISTITLTHGAVDRHEDGAAISVNFGGAYENCNEADETPCEPDLTHAPTVLITNTTIVENSAGAGAGVYNSDGKVTIENSLITQNRTYGSYGGGVYHNSGQLNIINSEISHNESSTSGGGIYSSGDSVTMTGNTIQYNSSNNQGGALIGYGKEIVIRNNLFFSNTVIGEAGGLGMYYAENVEVSGNTFQENSAKWTGGGMYISYGNNYQITNNNFISNSGGSGSGGGYYSRYITNSSIKHNTFTQNSAADGGAVKIYAHNTIAGELEQVQFEGNLLHNNSAENGGGIYIDGPGESYLTNNTITENEATTNGGGVFVEIGATAFIEHDTIVSNTTSLTISAVYIEANGTSTATATIQNSIIAYGDNDVCSGPFTDHGGNISSDSSCAFTSTTSIASVDPLLLPLADNGGDVWTHAIPDNSPAVDLAATSSALTDQRGVTRPQRSGYDSGAYELEANNTVSVTTNPAVDATLSFSTTSVAASTITTVEIPAGAVSETATFVYTNIETETVQTNYNFAGTRFEITAYLEGEAQESYFFVKPVTVTINYDESQLGGLAEEELILLYWTGSKWIDAAATCYDDDPSMVPDDVYYRDLDGNLISVQICHLTEFALFSATTAFDIYLPLIVSE